MNILRLYLALAPLTLLAQTGALRVIVEDPAGARVNASGELSGTGRTFATGIGGLSVIEGLAAGDYEMVLHATGFQTFRKSVRISAGQQTEERVSLTLAAATTRLQVLPGSLDGVPGAVAVITSEDLERQRPVSIKEALRRVSGVHIVDEDAFGLNLNISLRGLNPRRTQRTLLMEDGVPVFLGPYSDPTAHYHTPPEILEGVEVVKGSGQILYGPQTVGGMINFLTGEPPDRTRATIQASGGNRAYRNALLKLGTGGERGGVLGHVLYRGADGVREAHGHEIIHTGLSGLRKFSPNQQLQVRGSYYGERSRITEAGMSQAEFTQNPLGNPFRNDRFVLDRFALQGTHSLNFNSATRLSTTAYYQQIDRSSYRQTDFAGDEMTANAAAGCTGAARTNYVDFASRCGNKMRPRNYEFFGFEPRLERRWERVQLQVGIRGHREEMTRRRFNGLTPDARETSPGTLLRDANTIRTDAAATYGQLRFTAGHFTVTPGLRVEHIRVRNFVFRRGFNDRNATSIQNQTVWLPGLSVSYAGLPRTSFFAGVHRGLAPPRPDENLDPLDTRAIPVQAERSTNWEGGFRAYPTTSLQFEATLFRMDFANQIVPGVSVGLPNQTWANAGKTLNAGLELNTRWDLPGRIFYFTSAYTHIATAEFRDQRAVRGNRLPYAPRHLFTPALNFQLRNGLNWQLGLETVSEQFTDDANTRTGSANGQVGVIPGYTTLSAALNVPLARRGPVLFFSLANAADRRYIVSRVDGIHVGRPRQAIAGLRWQF